MTFANTCIRTLFSCSDIWCMVFNILEWRHEQVLKIYFQCAGRGFRFFTLNYFQIEEDSHIKESQPDRNLDVAVGDSLLSPVSSLVHQKSERRCTIFCQLQVSEMIDISCWIFCSEMHGSWRKVEQKQGKAELRRAAQHLKVRFLRNFGSRVPEVYERQVSGSLRLFSHFTDRNEGLFANILYETSLNSNTPPGLISRIWNLCAIIVVSWISYLSHVRRSVKVWRFDNIQKSERASEWKSASFFPMYTRLWCFRKICSHSHEQRKFDQKNADTQNRVWVELEDMRCASINDNSRAFRGNPPEQKEIWIETGTDR